MVTMKITVYTIDRILFENITEMYKKILTTFSKETERDRECMCFSPSTMTLFTCWYPETRMNNLKLQF